MSNRSDSRFKKTDLFVVEIRICCFPSSWVFEIAGGNLYAFEKHSNKAPRRRNIFKHTHTRTRTGKPPVVKNVSRRDKVICKSHLNLVLENCVCVATRMLL